MSIDLKQLPRLPLERKREFPKITGIYFVVSGEDVIYVGLTTNLKQRWSGHHLLKQFPPDAQIHWLEAEQAVLIAKEREFIAELTPSMNSNPGGNGRTGRGKKQN